MIIETYVLTLKIDGKNPDECAQAEQGAGEAKKEFLKKIRTMKYSADGTTIQTTLLVENP